MIAGIAGFIVRNLLERLWLLKVGNGIWKSAARSWKATTAKAALEQALITRFGTLERVLTPLLLRSDNAPRASTSLRQEFTTPHCPQ